MNISNFLVAALLLTAGGAAGSNMQPAVSPGETGQNSAVVKPAAPVIKLSGVTGTVQIKTAGGVMTVKAGEPAPDIPSGSEIIVVSGDADVAVGGVTVKAGAGDSFTVNMSGAGSVSIGVTGGLVSVVGADGVAKDVAKGESTIVSTGPSAPKAPAPPAPKVAKQKTPESIPADAIGTTPSPPPSSPSQEKAATTCVNTVSPSAPCP